MKFTALPEIFMQNCYQIVKRFCSFYSKKKLAIDSSKAAYPTLVAFSFVYFFFVLLLGIDRHWSFKTSIYDTGGFDQVIWNTLHHGAMVNTINLSAPINWLGFHFHPILYLFVPFYTILPAPEWLVLAQALAISITPFPIYKTALKFNYSSWQAFFWSLGYLLNPFILSAALWDFHPVTIATPLIALSIYFLVANEYKRLLASIIALLLCQEQFGILGIFIGICYYLINKHLKKSLWLIAAGAFFTLFLFLYIFPTFSPTGTHMMMSSEVTYLNRYGWLGHNFPEIIQHLLSSPLTVVKTALTDMNADRYFLQLLLPFGLLLPLFGFEILLIGTADFAANALSLIPLQRSIYSYHSITLIPIVISAAMLGYRRFCKIFSPRLGQRMITLTASAFLMLLINFLPSMFGKDSLWMLSPFPVKSPELEKIKKKIPENAVLSVQSNIGSHFSQRKFIFAYPAKVNEADYVILWMQDPNGIEIDNTFRFIHHMRMNQEDYLSSIKCLLVTRKFQIDYFNFPWLVLKRQSQATRISELPIVNYRLETLAQRWKIDNLNPSINQCIWTQ